MGTQSSWQGEQQSTSHNNGLVDQARGAVSEVAEAAKEQVGSQIGNQKGRLAEQIGGVAQALRDTSSRLEENDEVAFVSGYIGKAATQVERLADYLESRDVRDLLGEVQNAARREPAVFLGGLFTLGLVAGRFLKSSSPAVARNNEQGGRLYGQGTDRWSDDRGLTGSSAAGRAGAGDGNAKDYGATGSSSTGASGSASGTAGASFPISGTPPVPRPRPDVIPPAPIRDVGGSSSTPSATGTSTSGASSQGSPNAPAASPASSGTQTGSASTGSASSTTTTPGTGASPSTGTGSSSREPRGGSGAR